MTELINVKLSPDKCLACKACEVECVMNRSGADNINDAILAKPRPTPRVRIVEQKGKVRIYRCAQCRKPKCIPVCEPEALHIENGVVLLDEEKCNGCWECIEACPLNSIFKNEELGIAIKCDMCEGKEKLACVESCASGALALFEAKERERT